jgi:RNA polymerase sigma-70 factor, ECF subfamily
MTDTRDPTGALRESWPGFLESFEPLRPALYRYCRHLTRSPWDAEDLAQDVLSRAFVTLAQMDGALPNPRAWLFRVASNLWIDRTRAAEQRRDEQPRQEIASVFVDPRSVREAAGTLLGQLSPHERAAVVLKDVFGLSLDETAEVLETTVGAVKTALHRGRGKLVDARVEEPAPQRPAVLDAFCEAFNAGDLDRLASLLLDTASVELARVVTRFGPDEARRTVLTGMLFGMKRMLAVGDGIEPRLRHGVLPRPPRVDVQPYRGEWVLVHWFAHQDGEAVRSLTRIHADADGTRIARLVHHVFDPDLIAEVCGELALPSRSNGYRWASPKESER